jgi:CYTH domain-containing protein
MNNTEIERKFLVCGDFKSQAASSSRIRQAYINQAGGRTVRVRIRDEKAYLTIKGPSLDGGLSRFEWEIEIPVADAEQLLELRVSAVIDKRRYLVPFEGHTFEVDEFYGDNEGLVMAELELSEPDEAFARPSWLGQEVTGDSRYYNSHLSRHPFKEWAE